MDKDMRARILALSDDEKRICLKELERTVALLRTLLHETNPRRPPSRGIWIPPRRDGLN